MDEKVEVESKPKTSYKKWEEKYVKSSNSGAISGALNDDNDPYETKRLKHANNYYNSILKRNKEIEVLKILETSKKYDLTNHLELEDIKKIYEHVFINEYEINGVIKRFDPDFYMSVSWQRLREGKNVKEHDLILLLHERLEYDYMNLKGMNYKEAHNETNKKYNYEILVKELIKKGKN